jgi:hypothetical protein
VIIVFFGVEIALKFVSRVLKKNQRILFLESIAALNKKKKENITPIIVFFFFFKCVCSEQLAYILTNFTDLKVHDHVSF